MAYLARCSFFAGPYNNYLLAGNLCNAFAVGDIGAPDDFFLVGSEPDAESSYPLLTGNILDSEGNVLLRLVRNILVFNPGNCSKIAGDLCSYEIHDSAGTPIFSIRTMFECPPDSTEKVFLTTIKGTFFNRDRKVVLRANSGEPDEHLETNTKCCFGLQGGAVGLVQGYTEKELNFVRLVVATHGRIQRPLLGLVQDQEITLDGTAVIDASVSNCTIHVHSGNFALIGQPVFKKCKFIFHDEAENIRRLALALENPQKPDSTGNLG